MRTGIATGIIALTAAALLLAQTTRKSAAAGRVLLDAIVTDSAGRALPGLTASDFEVTRAGESPRIAEVTYVEARRAPADSPFQMAPWPAGPAAGPAGDNGRLNLVLVLDDLRLSVEAADQTRRAVEQFIDAQMQPGDRAAIVRTTDGTGPLQQLTSDKHVLRAALELLNRRPIEIDGFPAVRRDDHLADTTLAILRAVFDNLDATPGRRAVFLLSENMKLYQSAQIENELTSARANLSSVVFYTLDPRGLASASRPQSPGQIPTFAGLGALAKATGGLFFDNTNDVPTALARTLQDLQGYYRIVVAPGGSAPDASWSSQLVKGLAVKVKRSGALIRTRTEFPPASQSQAINNPGMSLEWLLPSPPLDSAGIHLLVTPLVSYAAMSEIGISLQIDTKDVAFTADSQGVRTGGLEVAAAAFLASGRQVGRVVQEFAIRISKSRFDEGLPREGFAAWIRVPLSASGPLQVHVVVRDTTSGRVGSARQFMDFPDLGNGQLRISGIFLSGVKGSTEPGENAGARVFKAGRTVEFTYAVFNARMDAEKKPRLQIRVRVLREGTEIYGGQQVLSAESDPDPVRRARTGSLTLHAGIKPGRYTLEISVTDSAAEPALTAAQSIDFEVR